MHSFRFPMDLQLFSEEGTESGVEQASAAETQDISSESGVESQAAAEPVKDNNFEKAFAKRLSAKEAEWDSKYQELQSQYQDYDVLRKATDYLLKQSGISDVMTLKEQLEMIELQDKAAQHDVPVEVMKRLEELEAKAAKAEELESKQKEEQSRQSYLTNLNEFVKDKGVEADKLNQFMVENDLYYNPENPQKSLEIALKAYRHDELLQKIEDAEKEGVKKFLAAKQSIPVVPGSTSQGQVTSPSPKTFSEARQRAMQRFGG